MKIAVRVPANAAYADPTGEAILLDVEIDGWPGVHRFAACSYDTEAHGRAMFAAAKAGEHGPIAAYVAPAAPQEAP